MYSYNDFERLFLRYKLEGVPSGVSIEQFCLSNKVPYNLFAKWYKDSRKPIILSFFDYHPGSRNQETPHQYYQDSKFGKRRKPNIHFRILFREW